MNQIVIYDNFITNIKEMNLMIFKSKDIDNIYVPDDEYFKQYAIKLAKESVARVVEKINSE